MFGHQYVGVCARVVSTRARSIKQIYTIGVDEVDKVLGTKSLGPIAFGSEAFHSAYIGFGRFLCLIQLLSRPYSVSRERRKGTGVGMYVRARSE